MSFGEDLVLRTRLLPPRLKRWTLTRSRLHGILERVADFRLAIVEAPTGYGKSTLLASWLVENHRAYAWCSLSQFEFDPFILLLHIIHAFRQQAASKAMVGANLSQVVTLAPVLGDRALEALEREWNEARTAAEKRIVYRAALQVFLNELYNSIQQDTYLVLDDFHLLEEQPELVRLVEDLIASAPPYLHVIISTRTHPAFENLPRWQVQQEIFKIGKEDLTFSADETARLFDECYGYRLSYEQASRLSTETEGWIIALQMVWQNLQSNNAPHLESMLRDLPHTLSGLFDYLALEVLNRQKPEVQNFLLQSSILRRMSGPICDYILELEPGQSQVMLRYLAEVGLFVTGQGVDEAASAEGRSRLYSYRYHYLFNKFLYSHLQKEPEKARRLHGRAASYLLERDQTEDALHHMLAGQDWEQAASLLESDLGARLINTGQLERLEHWLGLLPDHFTGSRPSLLLLQGDIFRLTSRFEEALHCYRQAISRYEDALRQGLNSPVTLEGLAQALRGRALVYLDTVQPSAAEEWLERALETVEKTGNKELWATLLRDLAENKLNRGRPYEAESLHRQARQLLGEPDNGNPGDVRILLRSGRLAEAIQYLEKDPELRQLNGSSGDNRHPRRATRSHREALLVLSLLDSLRGEKETAVSRAEQGIFLARELRTPFTEAVAWQRLGHALLVSGDYERSLQAYERGLELGEQLNVRRLQAEGLMGKGLLLGRNPGGNLVSARHALEEGLQVARWAGDEWIEGILQICLAAVLTEHAEYAEALGAAQTARAVLENCGDQFGLALAQLWTGLASSDHVELVKAIALCRRQNYGFLLEKPTIFGPKQGELFKRINEANRAELINGNRMGRVVPPLAQREHATALKITTLGIFSVLKPDGVELSPRDWQREKARQLFQLLLTHRDKPLSKDQIIEYLWPESDYVSAEARFKVALNALVKALEPERSSRSQSSYILRSGSGSNLSYALNTTPGVLWLDAIEFEKLAAAATHSELQERKANSTALELYTRALELYRGDFLPGCLYEDWAAAERERLLSLFLTTAERLTRLLAAQGEWERCQQICQLILARDNCWEEAYRLMILSQWKMGNRAAALRTYEKCVATLAEELGIEPMPQTTKLFNEILQD